MTETSTVRSTSAGRDLAILIARTASDMKCQDVVVLELGARSAVADYFILATGSGTRQIRSTAEMIQKAVQEAKDSRPWGKEGYESANWLLMDYVDVVVHLFDGAARAYYDLEMLWGDSPRVDWQRPSEETMKSER